MKGKKKISYMDCEHKNLIHDVGPFRCSDCGEKICTDCGSEPTWWFSHLSYCKRCHLKAGYSYEIKFYEYAEIDVDKILELTKNEELAKKVIEKLRYGDVIGAFDDIKQSK